MPIYLIDIVDLTAIREGRHLIRLNATDGARTVRRAFRQATQNLTKTEVTNMAQVKMNPVFVKMKGKVGDLVKVTVLLEAAKAQRYVVLDDPLPAPAKRPRKAAAPDRRVVDNEYFIRYIREHYPECPLTNSQIGRRMWSLAESRGAELVRERKSLKRVEAPDAQGHRSPTTAAEYQVREKDFIALQRFADRLGRAFSDGKGGFLVPAA